MKKVKRLFSEFVPESYVLFLGSNRKEVVFGNKLIIDGHKAGRPSKRITLHSNGLNIKRAKITKIEKGAEKIDLEVTRINRHKKFEELRLHTKEMLYPGQYEIILEYSISSTKANQLKSGSYDRTVMPSIDEPEAWDEAKVKVKQ